MWLICFLNYISPVVWMPLHAGRHTLFDLPLFTASRCRPNPCQNGGSCMSPKRSSFQCFCPDGYSGKFCEVGECNSLSVINRRNTSIPCKGMAWLVFSPRTKRLLLGGRRVLPRHGECSSRRGRVSGLEFLFHPAEREQSLQRVCRLWRHWTTQSLQVRRRLV